MRTSNLESDFLVIILYDFHRKILSILLIFIKFFFHHFIY